MAFEQEGDKIPSSIGDIELVLSDTVEHRDTGVDEPTTGREKTGGYRIRVLDQDGNVLRTRRGDLRAYLMANAPAVAQDLSDLLDWVRTEAETKILP